VKKAVRLLAVKVETASDFHGTDLHFSNTPYMHIGVSCTVLLTDLLVVEILLFPSWLSHLV